MKASLFFSFSRFFCSINSISANLSKWFHTQINVVHMFAYVWVTHRCVCMISLIWNERKTNYDYFWINVRSLGRLVCSARLKYLDMNCMNVYVLRLYWILNCAMAWCNTQPTICRFSIDEIEIICVEFRIAAIVSEFQLLIQQTLQKK